MIQLLWLWLAPLRNKSKRVHATHRAASRRPVILLFIAVPETFRALRGWMEPTVPENYFQLRPGYTPGDLDFDPLGLKPEDPEALKEMQTKESRAASKITTVLFVCVASMAWITRCFVCCGCLSVAPVAAR